MLCFKGRKKALQWKDLLCLMFGNMIAAPYNDLPLCQLMGRMNTALDHKFGCLRLYKVMKLDNQT